MTADALKLFPVLFAFENRSARPLRNNMSEHEVPEPVRAETIHVYTDILGPRPIFQDLSSTWMTTWSPLHPLLNCSEKSDLIPVRSHYYKEEGSKRGFRRDKVPEYGTQAGALASQWEERTTIWLNPQMKRNVAKVTMSSITWVF